MEQTARTFAVGLASIVAVIGLAALLLVFGELDRHLDHRYLVTIRTDQAAGLRAGSPVEMNGVPIGTVDAVEVRPGARWPVVVAARLDREVLLGVGTRPYAKQSLLGGVATLELDPELGAEPAAGEADDPRRILARDGTATIERVMLFRVVEQINAELNERMRPFTEAAESLAALGRTYREVGENLATLTAPIAVDVEGRPDPDAPANITTLVVRLGEATASAGTTLERIEALVSPDGPAGRLDDTLDRLDRLVERSAAAADAVGEAARGLDENADALRDRALPVADELARALADLRTLTGAIRTGDGTLGRLVNDPTLYRAMTDAAVRLDALMIRIGLLVEQLREEGLDIDFF